MAAFRETTETHTVNEMGQLLEGGDGCPIAVLTGICCRHNVFMRNSDHALIYFVSAESGPYNGLKKSWAAEREMKVWIPELVNGEWDSKNIAESTRVAVNFAMEEALSEVEQEMGI